MLANPVVIRMVLGLVVASFAFLAGLVAIKRVRTSLQEESDISGISSDSRALPLDAYSAVIQQLKQQKHELESAQQSERRRAKTSENISAAILSNLSCGILFMTGSGLVRQASPAARRILGFASPVGLSFEDVFRDPALLESFARFTRAREGVQPSRLEKIAPGMFEVQYATPGGEPRFLEVTMTAVHSPDGEILGTACLINDKTEMALIRRSHQLRGEISAEMALELRQSLSNISTYARQLAEGQNAVLARQIAADIATEAAHLDRTIGGFLAETSAATASAGA